MEDRVVSCFVAEIFMWQVEREIAYALVIPKHWKS